jgi:SAM-dependent methyltransferase
MALARAPAGRPKQRAGRQLRAPRAAPAPAAPAAAAATDADAYVYSWPRLYDTAFCAHSTRDFGAESAFLLRQAALHTGASGAPLSLLDLACGPGRHTHAAAAQGARSLGVDLSAAMVAYAQALQPGSGARFVAGDMTRLADAAGVAAGAPYDLVTCLYSSFTHLLTAEEAAACLAGVRALLSPRGLFALEFEHPRTLWDGSTRRGDGGDNWEVPGLDGFTADGLALSVAWGAPGDAWDEVEQVLHRSVSIDVYEAGGPAAPRRAVSCVIPTRFYGVQELRLLAAAAGLRVAATHGALREGVALRDADATRLVMLLCRA